MNKIKMNSKPRLLVISHVFPFPRKSGQQQRVYYKLKALRQFFHLTFAAPVPPAQLEQVRHKLYTLCDELILLPARYGGSLPKKVWHRTAGAVYSLRTALKLSNYIIGQLELTPARLAAALDPAGYDGVLYEYWHAVNSLSIFKEKGVPCILDMHNVLWQSYDRQLQAKPLVPAWWRRKAVARYQRQEEAAWRQFDALITINAGEEQYVRSVVPDNKPIFYAPMGTDLELWPYLWQPVGPPRLAYYGGLGSPHNQADALSCYKQIMPVVWREFPEAELWLVGSNPPDRLQKLSQDPRVTVTGYVESVQDVLKTMTLVVCPWSGTYGFRSRLIEVMALGIPVVASPDAVYGMGLEAGWGLFLEPTFRQMAAVCLNLLRNPEFMRQQSRLARIQTEEKFGYEATYGRLARNLFEFTQRQKVVG